MTVRMERRGECKMCGQCCYKSIWNPAVWARLPKSPLGDDTRMIPDNEDDKATMIVTDLCYQRGEDYKCQIFGKEERPEMCVNWPVGVTHLLPGCGYYFLEFHDNDEIAAIHRPGVRRKPI